jgi:nitrite reductase/ring-hydroxylating ferredoxin subunit
MPKEKIGSISEVPPGTAKGYKIKGFDLAIFNINGEFYAIDRKCTHLGGNLVKGKIKDKTVTCPLHGAKYNLETGRLLEQAGTIASWFKKAKNTNTYEITTEDDELVIALPDD